MKNYIELTLNPDLETPLYYLWEKLFQQIHLALVENKLGRIHRRLVLLFPSTMRMRFCWGQS